MSLSNEPMSTPSSSCGCWLPAGWYGSGGWHLRTITQEDVESRGEEGWVLKNYVGTPVAVEPCPAYRAVAQKQWNEGQAKRAAETVARPGRLRA